MTMHLMHPSLSMNGKRKGKTKFRNAEAAQKFRKAEADWKELKKKLGAVDDLKRQKRALSAPAYVPPKLTYRGAEEPRLPSLNVTLGTCLKIEPLQYTGDRLLGIGVMHKSNLVPIFSEDEARDISSMRR